MKRLLGLALMVTVAVMGIALHSTTAVRAADPSISVSPSSGSQDDTFAFYGVDFQPGEQLAVVYQDPSGQQYTYYTSDGSPDVITADDSGNWILSVHPRTDFAGAYAGTWTVAFCSTSGQCWAGTIDISV